MSEIKLVVRDQLRDASLICHGSDAHRVVAALSADPVTIEELDTALQRFTSVNPNGLFSGAIGSVDDEPWDSGLVVIDLAARLIAVRSTYFSGSHSGQTFYHNGEACTPIPVCYSLANEWEITDDVARWRQVADARRRERANVVRSPICESVLYGRPLIEFLSSRVLEGVSSSWRESTSQPRFGGLLIDRQVRSMKH